MYWSTWTTYLPVPCCLIPCILAGHQKLTFDPFLALYVQVYDWFWCTYLFSPETQVSKESIHIPTWHQTKSAIGVCQRISFNGSNPQPPLLSITKFCCWDMLVLQMGIPSLTVLQSRRYQVSPVTLTMMAVPIMPQHLLDLKFGRGKDLPTMEFTQETIQVCT